MAVDFSAYDKKVEADSELANANLGKISDICERYARVKKEIEEATAMLAELNKVKKLIEERDLPNAMLDLNLNKVELASGTKIQLTDFVYTSIPSANKDKAYQWLVDNGYDAIIKEKIILDSKENKEQILQSLEEIGCGYEEKKDIHYQTLNKFGREVHDTQEIPEGLFVFHAGKTAKIK